MNRPDKISRRFCVAPMLDCTDRHERYLARLMSQHAVLYTEMVTTGAILFGDKARFLDFNSSEHPVALQLGGSDPDAMTRCSEIAQQWGYDEVNINVGCPSDRVQSGSFGACLMQSPDIVAENVKQMQAAVDIPVTVKCRIGVDDQKPREALWSLVGASAEAGCKTFLVHARMAWLKGLSPKENRDVPPLDYQLVYDLKADFPELEIVINGGINTLAQCHEHLAHVDGVMMGREAYSNPYILAQVDQELYDESSKPVSRDDVLEAYIKYADQQIAAGARLNHLSKHVVGLYHGEPRSRLWRRHISENAHKPGSGTQVLRDANLAMASI
ncbi:tRNA dihydrouridine(20/20a) synthase DusA [Arenicella xantha]|uniref:tRNA-dihydrouridine(20/20a) synthase n=1 Tax=Arenicella xantha TaxID=644221 RepID=A0A395JP69_9GAMM|nr:tRNA dihydrouridine(20/20a) synthase DusA [Arenicella xantha]RBP53133.1 tRNA-U16,U17-dihydrouridine synthase [Arenicella xantha]